MSRLSSLWGRAYWLSVRARGVKERGLRLVMPSRMRFIQYTWPLLPQVCPCDVHFCDYLQERNVRGSAIFHFGSGGHHMVGLRNKRDGLGSDILAITASPGEHARYVREVIRDPSLGASYRVMFADIYNLTLASLPRFDLVTLFHLCEFSEPPSERRRLDDEGVLNLFLSRLAPSGRLLLYAGSEGYREARPLVERVVAEGRLSFEEAYKSLLIYRTPAAAVRK